MLISNLRNLDKSRKITISPDLTAVLEDRFVSQFLLILDEIFNQKQSDKFNNHFGLESVNSVFEQTNASLLLLPMRAAGNDYHAVLGSEHDLLNSFAHQIGMIYDLGCAFHSKMYVLKEQIVDILIGAFDGPVNLTGNNIFVNVSGKLDVSQENLIAKVKTLFRYIQKEKINHGVINAIPLPQANFRKVWIKNKTLRIAKLTRQFYRNESLELEESSVLDNADLVVRLNIEKIIGYSNLMNASFNKVSKTSIFENLLASMDYLSEQKDFLKTALDKVESNKSMDLDLLIEHHQQEKLCLDFIILAKRNKEIDRGERLFIYSYGKKINWDHNQIDNLLF